MSYMINNPSKYMPHSHTRNWMFNGVKRRLKVFLTGRGSFAGTNPTRSTFPSLLSPVTTSLLYFARFVLTTPWIFQPSLPPGFRAYFPAYPSKNFVLSYHFFFRPHSTLHYRSPNLQLTLYHRALFLNATFVSAISSCVLKQFSFRVFLPTWIITSPAEKAPLLSFFQYFLLLQTCRVKDEPL